MDPSKIVFVSEPGLVDHLQAGTLPEAVGDAEPLLRDFVTSPTVVNTSLGDEVGQLLETSRGLDEDTGSGFWAALHRMFEPDWHVKVGEQIVTVELGLYYLVPPPVPECSVTLSVKAVTDRSGNASVKVFGVGGGPTTTLTMTESFARSTGRPETFVVTAPARFEKFDVRLGPGKGTSYLRLAEVERRHLGFAARPYAPLPSQAATDATGISETLPIDLRGQGGRFKKGSSIARGVTWEASIGLSLESLGLAAELTCVGSYNADVELEYDLPGGHRYLGRRSTSQPVYTWTVT